MLKRLLLPLALLCAAPVSAQPQGLQTEVETVLAGAPAGTRFGLLVVDAEGREIVAIAPEQRFIPASNTKMFTTAAAYAVLGGDQASLNVPGLTTLGLLEGPGGIPDVVLSGSGGVSLSTAPDCIKRCLSALVEKLPIKGNRVGRVIADDTAFVDQRWSPGMSWNNIQTDSGTATSALIVDDNERELLVRPGAIGQPPVIEVSSYFIVRNEAMTAAAGAATRLDFERDIDGRGLRIHGTIAEGASPWRELVGIADPADYAGWAVKQALEAKGIRAGKVTVRHRPAQLPGSVTGQLENERAAIAVGEPDVPLDEMVTAINKESQNLLAEALLRRIGQASEARDLFGASPAQPGSREAGLTELGRVLAAAGIPRAGYDFSDGSGMSTYNRVSPRASVALLRWIAAQPWGEEWYASLPVAGVDGTLKRRFVGTPLAGNLAAKTGTLNASNALSGRFRARSGRMLTFALFANDVPDGSSALATMEAALLLLAERN